VQVGPTFKEKTEQYACRWDAKNKVFLIVDLWHESITELEVGDDVPSEAIKVVTEGEFAALFKEASRIRKIPKVGGQSSQVYTEPATSNYTPPPGIDENVSQRDWQSFQLRMRALKSIESLILTNDLNRLTQ